MADRKAELERKKLKLEQMRKEREEKNRQRKVKEGGEEKKVAPTSSGQSQDLRAQTDELLSSLGIPPASGNDSQAVVQPVKETVGPNEGAPATSAVTTQQASRRKAKLTVTKVGETNIPPRENVTYSKETQTIVVDTTEKEDEDTDSIDVHPAPTHHKMPHVENVHPTLTQEDIQKQEEKPIIELSEEEKKQIMMTEEFQTFFNKTTRVVERALDEEIDIFVDYAGGESEDMESDLRAGERLKLQRNFFDERWSKHRTVTSLDWSKQHPELLVASYNANEDSPNDPDGVTLIWNSKFKKTTPEYVFHCQSPVMSSCFAEFHPNLVVGGTYSGQIVLWDNRVNKRTPIQRTPLSAAAHTHPVYCINVVGTQNAHNLISVSTDGKMCSWSLDMLSQPQDSMELQHKQSKAVAVTCFSFLSGDVNNFVVGSEDCTVYTACRHGGKTGISEAFEGHMGPITGIDCHNVPGQIDFSPYFLTSSFDWTLKLWSIKDQKFLHSFEDNSDYVYDVQWSPIHPALFASVDGDGRLDLWNLNNETEVPTASVVAEGGVALNHCRWHGSGSSIAVGDDVGRIHIYDVAENTANPKMDEWSRFVRTLQELKQQAVEREEESSLGSVSMTSPLR
ncbi:cytoplasmic dynein 1 intermediate chain 2 isoform X31 [Magallana gigas]|uniref:cytoplasmic dynein 1 intermediate chain 2 isoform X31 n=1 Tax=Magallana gigas TaxID=29159 RepID=UPI0005C3AE07|nr:cytoplasmic dynein 1 intermediate chain 2 isoform X31 [Crassostrea gigas]|eukprot:XP_011422392.1 PREDICTED: cytoplasmic dynein 1 intermediate chain 2 isoform X19 [Crassostrea gigas]